MLSVVDLDRGRANYYLARAKIEYLQEDGADGLWYGKGVTSLGLSGKVEADKFQSLFQGYLGGTQLVHSAGRNNHFAGVDLAFSAPKAVSCLWAVSEPPRPATIENCQLRAVKAALNYLE
jgi:conjugative relaxase-like TrwC/TraI family protein